ncbi:MalM family protein [Marinobacter sp. es.048]|uniref:MalM family protein n=1 Tax=Marinobacter sp. es.048 TaxID=1761795 RepID=UPI000B597F05|nr:MalM family protein [Marinobacter sp. es.048]
MCLFLVAVLGGCQGGGSTVSEREGYFTWVDEQGRVRYSPIAGAENSKADKDAEALPDPGSAEEPAQPDDGASPESGLKEENEYTLENYPDAGELEEDGYVRPGERQPYFTWRDAEGNVRVSYYRPDTRSDLEKGLVEPPVQITEASIYHADPDGPDQTSVEGYDPDAFAILGIEAPTDDFFTRFSATCCETLDAFSRQGWQSEREFGVTLSDGSETHPFLTGTSPYQLIALPDADKHASLVIRLHSYAKDGVFVPSLVFLDQKMAPLRLVTDLVMDFTPENWHRRGYLEAWVPAFPGQGERWLVLFTREQDLEGQTVIETRVGPQKIPHIRHGEIGLMQVEE